MYCFENGIDPDQLYSQKPAYQDLQYFHSACQQMLAS